MPFAYLPINVPQVQKAITLIEYAVQREGDNISDLVNTIHGVAPHIRRRVDGCPGKNS